MKRLILIAIASGLTGYGYIKLYETISKILHRDHSHRNLLVVTKVVSGSFLAAIIAFTVNIDIYKLDVSGKCCNINKIRQTNVQWYILPIQNIHHSFQL